MDPLNDEFEHDVIELETTDGRVIKKKKFRLQCKHLFLTYPQCSLPLNVASKLIEDVFGGRLSYGIVCKENHHESDGEHIHAFISLTNTWNIVNPHRLDLELKDAASHRVYHGNYQPARSVYSCIKYVCKDGNFIGINCDAKQLLKAAKAKTSTKSAMIAEELMDGRPLYDINTEYPGYVLSHLKKLMEYKNWLEGTKLIMTPLLPWNHVTTGGATERWIIFLCKWINSNMGKERRHKQRQLWISGRKNSGKTYLIMQLMRYFHGYEIPNDGRWLDDYSDDYDFAYIDEYKGFKTIQWLNSFAEGRPVPLPQRNRAPYIKKKNIPFIVSSNYGISQCYSQADELVVDALRSRFLEIKIPFGQQVNLVFEHDTSDDDTAPIMSDSEWEVEDIDDDGLAEEGPSIISELESDRRMFKGGDDELPSFSNDKFFKKPWAPH